MEIRLNGPGINPDSGDVTDAGPLPPSDRLSSSRTEKEMLQQRGFALPKSGSGRAIIVHVGGGDGRKRRRRLSAGRTAYTITQTAAGLRAGCGGGGGSDLILDSPGRGGGGGRTRSSRIIVTSNERPNEM